MELNNIVENFYNKHRSNIILASHSQTSLESILRDLFQEIYEIGHTEGYADCNYNHTQNVKLEPIENILL